MFHVQIDLSPVHVNSLLLMRSILIGWHSIYYKEIGQELLSTVFSTGEKTVSLILGFFLIAASIAQPVWPVHLNNIGGQLGQCGKQ